MQQGVLATLGIALHPGKLDPNFYLAAAPNPRKRALLVGIDNYQDGINLKGAVTDVELQRELLIHRLGFQPADILTLTNRDATREEIVDLFQEHLKGSNPSSDDVLFFHFSGYGEQLALTDSSKGSSDSPGSRVVANLRTYDPGSQTFSMSSLLALAQNLPTSQFTAVLDTSFASPPSLESGNLRWRSRISDLNSIGANKSIALFGTGKMKGVFWSAAAPGMLAAEAKQAQLTAGLFTYALTQTLWESLPPLTSYWLFQETSGSIAAATNVKQQPLLTQSASRATTPYFQAPTSTLGGEGRLLRDDGNNSVELSLAGLPWSVLKNYQANSYWTVASTEPTDASPLLRIRSRQGQQAKASWVETVPSSSPAGGVLLTEQLRAIPQDLNLTVGLSRKLERIERVDATSALANIDWVTNASKGEEQPVDCIFSKLETGSNETGYGLFTSAGKLIRRTNSRPDEAVKSAVLRLTGEYRKLLALKYWRLLNNRQASGLPLRTSIEVVDANSRVLLEERTRGYELGNPTRSRPKLDRQTLATVASGTQLQLRIENAGASTIYLQLLGLDTEDNAIALISPAQPADESGLGATLNEFAVAPGKTIILPDPTSPVSWSIAGSAGLCHLCLLATTRPFTQSQTALQTKQALKGNRTQIASLVEPLAFTKAVLRDLQAASEPAITAAGISRGEDFLLANTDWASLEFIFRVT
ncbi:MAG: caspase family protein [Cyanobacteria bacterium P01_H01_bin.15]